MERPPRSWPLEAARVALLVLAVALHGVLGLSLASSWGTDEFARRDWAAFRDAGRRALDGDVAHLYDPRPGGFPYLHPPWVAAILAPFGGLGDAAFYGLMVALQLGGLALALFALRRLESDEDACALARVDRRFAEAGGDVRALLIAIATSHGK